jgi:hypothetical protein
VQATITPRSSSASDTAEKREPAERTASRFFFSAIVGCMLPHTVKRRSFCTLSERSVNHPADPCEQWLKTYYNNIIIIDINISFDKRTSPNSSFRDRKILVLCITGCSAPRMAPSRPFLSLMSHFAFDVSCNRLKTNEVERSRARWKQSRKWMPRALLVVDLKAACKVSTRGMP